MIFVSIIGSLCWSSGWWWWPHIRDRRFRDVFRRLHSWIHIHIEWYNLGRWKIPWQRKNTCRDPPPFQLMVMIITVIYGVPDQERRYPNFTKKKVLTYRLRGCRASRGERRRSANLRHIMVSIQIFANLHYIEVSICFNITIIGILVLVVISVLKILLFTVNTSLITNLSKWCIIHCFNSDFVFL